MMAYSTSEGIKYTFPLSFYPAVAFMSEQLQEFYPRFGRVTARGQFEKCVSNGQRRLNEIQSDYKYHSEKISVSVFNDPGTKSIPGEKQLCVEWEVDDEGLCEKAKVTWTDWQLQCVPSQIAVWVVPGQEYLEKLSSSLIPQRQWLFDNLVVYVESEQKAYRLDPLFRVLSESRSSALCQKIQDALELQVVNVLDKIADFTRLLVPHAGQPDPSKTALSQIRMALDRSLKDRNVIGDLSPLDKKFSHEESDIIKPGEMGDDERKKRNKTFHDKLFEFVGKKVKFVLCEYYSTKYGCSPSIVNDFLNADFFNLEKKIDLLREDIVADEWPFEYGVSGAVYVCTKFAYDCKHTLTDLIEESEKYIQEKMKVLRKMENLQFELHGILKSASVSYRTTIPESPKLDPHLRGALLELPEIYACGHIYGQLTLHSKENVSPNTVVEIESILKKYKYPSSYSNATVSYALGVNGNNRNRGRVDNPIEHGRAIRASGSNNTGTLGCFVYVSDQNEAGAKSLQGISCAHCVDTSDAGIEMGMDGGIYELIGRVRLREYEPDFHDIMLIDVKPTNGRTCCTYLKKACGVIPAKIWQFSETLPAEGSFVYQVGASSGVRKGTVVSNDYVTKTTKSAKQSKGVAEASAGDKSPNAGTDSTGADQKKAPQLDHTYTLLIVPREDDDIQQAVGGAALQFSVPGDSGSTVCSHDKTSAKGVVVHALLCGSIDYKDTSAYICSHASYLPKLLKDVGENHNISILAACPGESGSTNPRADNTTRDNVSRGPSTSASEGNSSSQGSQGSPESAMDGILHHPCSSEDECKHKREGDRRSLNTSPNVQPETKKPKLDDNIRRKEEEMGVENSSTLFYERRKS